MTPSERVSSEAEKRRITSVFVGLVLLSFSILISLGVWLYFFKSVM